MSSAVSRIVIKSDHILRRIPQLGQTVGIAGQPGLYVVMDLDHDKRVAQVMEKSGKHRLIDVPFASVRALNRRLVEAIHRLLDSREQGRQKLPTLRTEPERG